MKFTNTVVSNFEGAFRGLRNPFESWSKSDSIFGFTNVANDFDLELAMANKYCYADGLKIDEDWQKYGEAHEEYVKWLHNNGILRYNEDNTIFEYAYLGPKDLDLARRMIKAGSSDRKFLRQIFVSVDITAPLYWWKEIDTYKIGTVANSTSTMHKLASTPITMNCFEKDDYDKTLILSEEDTEDGVVCTFVDDMSKVFINYLEGLRLKYLKTKNKKYWKELIRWLPEGWLQTRTWTGNYEVLRNQYFQREYHPLQEWHSFCRWIESLPYAEDLITYK